MSSLSSTYSAIRFVPPPSIAPAHDKDLFHILFALLKSDFRRRIPVDPVVSCNHRSSATATTRRVLPPAISWRLTPEVLRSTVSIGLVFDVQRPRSARICLDAFHSLAVFRGCVQERFNSFVGAISSDYIGWFKTSACFSNGAVESWGRRG